MRRIFGFQHAAVTVGTGWSILDNTIRDNTGMGLFHKADAVVRGNRIHHNRHSGIGGFKAHRSLVELNEVFSNGAALVSGESGGAKWVAGIDLTIRDNHFYDNLSNGLWLDADNENAVVTGNLIERTTHPTVDGKGLHWEISCSGFLSNNMLIDNEAGVFLIASRDTMFTDNTITGSNVAIRVAQDHRVPSHPTTCPWTLHNMNVIRNTVEGGLIQVIEHRVFNGSIFTPGDTRLVFDFNNYTATTFTWGGFVSWPQWQGVGNDPNGAWTP